MTFPHHFRELPIGIYGAGRVGTALAMGLRRERYRLAGVASRTHDHARAAAKAADTEAVESLVQLAERSRVLLLAVSDNALEPTARRLAQSIAGRDELLLVHLSGALPASLLRPAPELAYDVAGWHPMCSFAIPEAGLRNLKGAFIGVEATSSAQPGLVAMAEDLGGRPLKLNGEGKVLYHAAACMASNYGVTLLELAQRRSPKTAASKLVELASETLDRLAGTLPEWPAALELSGDSRALAQSAFGELFAAAFAVMQGSGVSPEDGRDALLALLRGTLANVSEQGPFAALTGPIARGDAVTIERHVAALGALHHDLKQVYVELGLRCVDLAQRRGLNAKAVADVRERLTEKHKRENERS